MRNSLDAELSEVRELALAAGAMLLEGMGRVGPVARKQANELVTETDRRVEEMVLAGLRRVFPGDAIEAEESGAADGTTGRTWHVDPLDGTTNYAHGHPFFAVSMACTDEDGLALGAVFAPYLDELYLAHRGGGAVCERPRLGTAGQLPRRPSVGLTDALLATGFPYVRDAEVDRVAGRIVAFLKAGCHGVRRAGSAAIDLVHVAAGKLDGYWETRLRPWDTAAGTLIAREAGVLVTAQDGRKGVLHHEDILAAAPGLHAEMLAILSGSAGEGRDG